MGSCPRWGSGTVGCLPGSFPWTCTVGPGVDGNDPNCHPSHSSSVLRPSACLTNPSAAGPAPSSRPASSTSDASPSVFFEFPAPRIAPPRWVLAEWGAVSTAVPCHPMVGRVQKEVRKSKEERRTVLFMGSPFTQDIQDKPLPVSFRHPTLEAYNESVNPTKYVAAFQGQMTLYGTSDANVLGIPYHPPRPCMDIIRLIKASLSFINRPTGEGVRVQLPSQHQTKPLNSNTPRPELEEEPLSHFVSRFTIEIWAVLMLIPL
ncbi:hypothetical protein GW17_00047431 [Ensete ventricosum]|nr:hypothetical protein GW17_00047431 [Ensete ventricosum]